MGEHAYRTEDEALGEELVRFRWKGMPAATVIIAIVFIALPVGMWLAALTGAMPMGEDWNIGSYFGAAIFSLMPFFGAWFMFDVYRRRNDYAIIYQDGVDLFQKGTRQRARFRDVVALRSSVKQEIRNGIPGPVVHRHALRRDDRTEIVFTQGFEDIDGLAAALRRKTEEHLLPRAREALREGRSVSFGAITLTRDGLAWRGTTVPWKELGVVDIAEGSVRATRAGKDWLSVDIAEIDNVHVLVPLAAERDFSAPRKAAAGAVPL